MINAKITIHSAIKIITENNEEQLVVIPDNLQLSKLKEALDICFPNYKKVYLENNVGILNIIFD